MQMLQASFGDLARSVQASMRVEPAPAARIAPYVMPEEKAVFAQYAGDASCAECHAAEHAKWKGSNHGLAERLPNPQLDLAAFEPAQRFQHGSQTTEARRKGDLFEILSPGFDRSEERRVGKE
jgi:hypothetical protein